MTKRRITTPSPTFRFCCCHFGFGGGRGGETGVWMGLFLNLLKNTKLWQERCQILESPFYAFPLSGFSPTTTFRSTLRPGAQPVEFLVQRDKPVSLGKKISFFLINQVFFPQKNQKEEECDFFSPLLLLQLIQRTEGGSEMLVPPLKLHFLGWGEACKGCKGVFMPSPAEKKPSWL